MVRLYEYKGKELLKTVKIPIPEGYAASTPEEVKKAAEQIGKPVVIKAQIFATGRFKAGGIKFADTPEEAEKVAKELIGSEVKGLPVKEVLVEEKLDIEQEFYTGVIVDPSREVSGPVLIFSTAGGVGIEEAAREFPDKVSRMNVDYQRGVRPYDAFNLALKAGAPRHLLNPLSVAICGVYEAFAKYEARSAEINPLVLTTDGKIIAADCRITVDDSAIFRHPELGIRLAREFQRDPTTLELVAWTIEEGDYRGNAFFSQMVTTIDEPGYVGYHGIGGGGAILGVDALNRQGLKIANYSDSSGDPTASKVYRLAKTILAQPGIEGFLLGGFIVANQEQWHHAHGLVKALREDLADKPGFPVVLLICGNREPESKAILDEGLKDMPIRFEIYGSEYVFNPDFIAERMRALIDEYRKDKEVA
ncbi:MAG: acetate--CoA ligase family protein [Candidatus Bathyarchaeota archaeon]|nr:acetate--CoA ligase family protein [Candidatus Bathyarchaeota archaeon]